MIQGAWILSIVFLGLAGIGLIVLVHNRRQPVPTRQPCTNQWRYFVQPQVNDASRVVGYECLLRKKQADGTWSVPQEDNNLTLGQLRQLLAPTFSQLPETPISLAVNLTYEQIMGHEFANFVHWTMHQIAPLYLTVEYRSDQVPGRLQQYHFLQNIRAAQDFGAKFAVDNVGSDLQALKHIEWLLPVVDVLKCSMAAFRKDDPSIWLHLNLGFWNQLAKERQINLVLTGVETEEDAALARQLKIQFCQGNLVGEPVEMPAVVPPTTQTALQRPRDNRHVEHIE
ncbi:EAL domain-containing protein [Schleiferilactobacillus harbinensis]|uniref:Diguanylate cyclase phosphodiesterase domain-containing protein n=1 Tax=Schleiferilactobacillus harbinensis DSM 16991 TaxID=1122147 RepID=A0A0R1XF06_9LACO|nr:EAL domain-containing protein [Schleiferilactobacillus harbinensis]KRM26022.1 diguanylate cyclase phosphodiesterase domain-containing protein [Schleiferilactobacillus harbinensis DSM 16991]QFR63493.1 EAL domain-containing protein [Schleiferilactobacillus harbinensis]